MFSRCLAVTCGTYIHEYEYSSTVYATMRNVKSVSVSTSKIRKYLDNS